MGKTVPEVGTQDRGHNFSDTDRQLGWRITYLFFSSTERKACELKTRTAAVIMARFATNCTISTEQTVIKTGVIQVEERGFTERFLFT